MRLSVLSNTEAAVAAGVCGGAAAAAMVSSLMIGGVLCYGLFRRGGRPPPHTLFAVGPKYHHAPVCGGNTTVAAQIEVHQIGNARPARRTERRTMRKSSLELRMARLHLAIGRAAELCVHAGRVGATITNGVPLRIEDLHIERAGTAVMLRAGSVAVRIISFVDSHRVARRQVGRSGCHNFAQSRINMLKIGVATGR